MRARHPFGSNQKDTRESWERWLIGHAGELSAAGLEVHALREQARQFGPSLARAAQAMLGAWLDGLTA